MMCPCLACNGTGRYRDRADFNFQKFCYVCLGTGRAETLMSSDQEYRFQEALKSGMSELEATRYVDGSQYG
jgi:hypothetical protein